MSGNDKDEDSGSVVQFPRVFLPASFDAPGPDPRQGVEQEVGGGQSVPASWPRLPGVDEMRPPLALTMPGIPDAGAEEEGAFAPPQMEDPDNPTARDTLQLAMALMTAMGVAAAQGMWHRARHRSALADQARAHADKATAKAAAAGSRTPAGGAETKRAGSLLRSRQEGSHKKPHGPRGGGRGGGGRTGHDGERKKRKGPKRGPDRGRRPGDDKSSSRSKAPKAGPRGRTTWDRDKSKRRKRRPDKDAGGQKRPDTRTPEPKGKSPKQPAPDAAKKTSGKSGLDAKRPGDPGPLTWKAPKRGKGAKDDGEAKRWTGGRPKGGGKPLKKPKGGASKDESAAKTSGGSRRPGGHRLTWKARKGHGKAGAAGTTRWTAGRPGAGRGRAASGAKPTGDYRDAAGSWKPPPPPGWEGMRPPPGANRRAWVTVDSVKVHRRPRPPKVNPAVLAAGMPALPPGAATKPGPGPEPSCAPETGQQPPPKTDSDVKTGASVAIPAPRLTGAAIPVHGAQFRDAELTIRDVIEAGEEMAEEILAGADTAQRSAAMCEMLAARLEALHAELCELEVPGILIPNVAVLLDKAQDVRGKALAIAEGLPLASEAMKVAAANAAVRHQPTADMTRDMGHIKPAERPYHEE